MGTTHCDVAVVGGGLVGLSLAFELAGRYSVLHVDPDAFPVFASAATSAQEARAWAVGR